MRDTSLIIGSYFYGFNIMRFDIGKNSSACLFSVHNIISSSHQKQVCLIETTFREMLFPRFLTSFMSLFFRFPLHMFCILAIMIYTAQKWNFSIKYFFSKYEQICIFWEILRISPYSFRIQENTDLKKFHIWTLFMQCWIVLMNSLDTGRKLKVHKYIN